MQSSERLPNDRLQRVLAIRQLGGGDNAPAACTAVDPGTSLADDFRLFALTFAGGFLFTTIFLA